MTRDVVRGAVLRLVPLLSAAVVDAGGLRGLVAPGDGVRRRFEVRAL